MIILPSELHDIHSEVSDELRIVLRDINVKTKVNEDFFKKRILTISISQRYPNEPGKLVSYPKHKRFGSSLKKRMIITDKDRTEYLKLDHVVKQKLITSEKTYKVCSMTQTDPTESYLSNEETKKQLGTNKSIKEHLEQLVELEKSIENERIKIINLLNDVRSKHDKENARRIKSLLDKSFIRSYSDVVKLVVTGNITEKEYRTMACQSYIPQENNECQTMVSGDDIIASNITQKEYRTMACQSHISQENNGCQTMVSGDDIIDTFSTTLSKLMKMYNVEIKKILIEFADPQMMNETKESPDVATKLNQRITPSLMLETINDAERLGVITREKAVYLRKLKINTMSELIKFF